MRNICHCEQRERVGVQDFKGRECNSQKDVKEYMLDKQMFAEMFKNNKTEKTLIKQALLGSSLPTVPSSYYNIVSMVTWCWLSSQSRSSIYIFVAVAVL